MGTLFSFMQSGVDVSDVYVDFRTAKPKEDEEKLCNEANVLIRETGQRVIDSLRQYQACGELIRKALSDPTPQNEQEAFQAVKPNVAIINSFYQIGVSLETVFPELLKSVAKDDEKRSLQEYQAICRTMADTIEFALLLDELKMLKPGIQNDFAYYKRALGRRADDPTLVVRDETASMISMFIAQPIPIMNVLSKSARKLADSNPNVGRALATMANVCLHLVKNRSFGDDAAVNLLCVKTMVGCIVIFDHVDPIGAFVKRSGINIKQAVALLTKDYSSQTGLINAIRFSTLHYQDDSTPSAITQMLETSGH